MSEFNNLKLEIADQTAVLSISRPAALNALNSETLDELNTALTEIEAMDDVKVVILTGGPDKKGNEFKSFVAGADISEMVNFTAPEARAFGIKASVPFFKLMNMRQVTIAAVNGFALGGGCEIAMACDIRIASDNAVFGQPECGLGIIPGFGGTQRLARLVGMGRAKEMIFTCDNIDANEAYRIGLVNKVVAKEELMATAKLWLQRSSPREATQSPLPRQQSTTATTWTSRMPLRWKQTSLVLSTTHMTRKREWAHSLRRELPI